MIRGSGDVRLNQLHGKRALLAVFVDGTFVGFQPVADLRSRL